MKRNLLKKYMNQSVILGIYLSLASVTLGSILFLNKFGKHSQTSIEPLISASFTEVLQLHNLPIFLLAFGFFLLLLIQVMRTLAVTMTFLLKKDWAYFCLSLIVCILLIASISSSYLRSI